jgi:hypothetical protein
LSLDRPPRLRQGFLDAVALERTLKSTRDVTFRANRSEIRDD